jgi:hypothetical protein
VPFAVVLSHTTRSDVAHVGVVEADEIVGLERPQTPRVAMMVNAAEQLTNLLQHVSFTG